MSATVTLPAKVNAVPVPSPAPGNAPPPPVQAGPNSVTLGQIAMRVDSIGLTPAQVGGVGLTPGADALLAQVQDLQTKLTKKKAKIADLQTQIAPVLQQKVAALEGTLAKRQNKISQLRAKLDLAQTDASSKKTQAIVAESKLGQSQAAAKQSNTTLIAIAIGGLLAWKFGLLKKILP